MRTDSLVDLWRVFLDLAKNSRMIYRESMLPHHLFNVSIRKLVAAVPTAAQKDNCWLEVPPLKRK
jgi:hypothetical protein